MPSQEITWQVPEDLYRELLWAQEELAYPSLISNSRFVAAISKSRVSSRIKHPARLRNRGYGLTFHP